MKDKMLHHLFKDTVEKYGDKIAIHDININKKLTYQELLIASLILSSKLKSIKDKNIGIMVPNSAGAILSVLANLILGKTCVMINYSTSVHENCTFAQHKCGFHHIITSKKLLDKLDIDKKPGMIFLEDILDSITLYDKILAFTKSKFFNYISYKNTLDENAFILFTSGSEREPKTVQLTHKNFISNLMDVYQIISLNSNDIFISVLPLFHVFGVLTGIWVPLLCGASIVTHANPLDYQKVAESIKNYSGTCITATPSFFRGYLKKSAPGDFKTLRYPFSGGDKILPGLAERYFETHGITLYEGYGTTETSSVISANSDKFNKPGSVGKPLPGVEVRILDIDHGHDLGIGETGKIVVRGNNVMKGYLSDLDETSVRIHDGWYDTGDMGFIDDDGYLWINGRLKRFVKIAGEMVSLTQVEHEAEKIISDESFCCAVEIPHSIKGSEIVLAVTEKVEERSFIKKMSTLLPGIAVPKKIIFIENLPMMATGKVNFRKTTEIVYDKLEL